MTNPRDIPQDLEDGNSPLTPPLCMYGPEGRQVWVPSRTLLITIGIFAAICIAIGAGILKG